MISFGSTGTMMPTAIMSRATVMNTNMNAADPGARDPLIFTCCLTVPGQVSS
jgi:hypothetical protein